MRPSAKNKAARPKPERYSRKRVAELLLSNAIGKTDYRSARDAVQKLGVDPDLVLHARPGKNSLTTKTVSGDQ